MFRAWSTINRSVLIAVTASALVFPTEVWSAEPSPIQIPKRGDPGWSFGPADDKSVPAPSGYEGRTDTSSLTATGNAPETRGKRVAAHFELSNKIKTCPMANGTVEGEGTFLFSVQATNVQGEETSTITIESRATAKYKGTVSDKGYLEEPVIAEIDYTYTHAGTTRHANGGLTTTGNTPTHQNITIPFMVPLTAMAPPEMQGFSGGDPMAGHYAEAYGVGMALAYWGGVYYSIAQTRWRLGECAQVVFDPSTSTVALGAETTVKVQVKSKEGGFSKANFTVIPRRDGGFVTPGAGSSDEGSPLKLTYKAPDKKAANAGFHAVATSRAGVAEGDWKAGLGTGWNGQITCTREMHDGGDTELLTWSYRHSMKVTYDVSSDVGTATGHGEVKDVTTRKQKALRGGAVIIITTSNESITGSVSGSSPATVNISLNNAKGTYSIGAAVNSLITGNTHTSICSKNGKCYEADAPFYVDSCIDSGIRGNLSDLNHLSGSTSDTKPAGYQGKGTQTLTVTWNLSRQGSQE